MIKKSTTNGGLIFKTYLDFVNKLRLFFAFCWMVCFYIAFWNLILQNEMIVESEKAVPILVHIFRLSKSGIRFRIRAAILAVTLTSALVFLSFFSCSLSWSFCAALAKEPPCWREEPPHRWLRPIKSWCCQNTTSFSCISNTWLGSSTARLLYWISFTFSFSLLPDITSSFNTLFLYAYLIDHSRSTFFFSSDVFRRLISYLI